MTNIEKVNNFLDEAKTFYFLTTDGDKPKGRPFGFHILDGDKLYFGCGTFKCPYATAQSLISGKWAILIMHYLEDGPIRFNELQRLMPKMTHATLSVQLKSLVDNGLVERKQYESIPPKVEYSLTEMGKKFHPVIDALQNWGYEYIEYLQKDKG